MVIADFLADFNLGSILTMGPSNLCGKKAPRMKCTPDGTITYKNKRCGDGLPAPNGMMDKKAETGEGVFLGDAQWLLSVYRRFVMHSPPPPEDKKEVEQTTSGLRDRPESL